MEASVEARLQDLEGRMRRLEAAVAPPKPFPVAPQPAPLPPRPPESPRGPQLDLEELLGGRVLAWVGGAAVVLGVVFFLALAIHRGWIDEPTRVALAFAGSTALFGVGLWLYERQGRTQAALATMAAAIAALYASDTAATALYHLVSPAVGLAVGGVIGLVATIVAVRWESQVVAGIGVVGALLAPVLVDAGTTNASLAFMAIALGSAVGILLWRRWGWLAGLAYVVSLPQLVVWVSASEDAHRLLVLVVLGVFWALYVAGALGYELREPTAKLRVVSTLLLLANAGVTAALGWGVLHDRDPAAAKAWLLAIAAAHVGLGVAVLRSRISGEIGALLVAVGAALAAVGLSVVLSGPALVAGYAAEAVLLSLAARRTAEDRGHIGAGAFLALAIGHVLAFEAPPDALAYGVDSLPTALVGLALAAGACLACAWAFDVWRPVLVGVAAVLGLYAGSVAIVDAAGADQGAQLLLSAFWTVTGLAALVVGLVRDLRPLRLGGLTLLGVAVGKVFVVDLAALESVYRVGSFLALGLLLLAGAFAYQRIRTGARS